MKIVAAVSTYQKPLRLAAALASLTVNESGRHEVSYVLRVNEDDHVTRRYLADLQQEFPVEVLFRPRPVTLGQCWNECVAGLEWDACAVIADKHLCMTQRWDDLIATAMGAHMPALRWTLLREPLETVLILSRKWYDATGRVFPEWFPFWFSERWIYEVHQLAFGAGIPRANDMPLHEPTVKTQNLRDLEFWFDFFAKTRILRIVEAGKVAAAFGTIMPRNTQVLAELRQGDEWQKPRIAGYYETRSGPWQEATAEYHQAKRLAEQWLHDNAAHVEEAYHAA